MDIAARRRELRMTQGELADAVKCSQAHISNLERGKDNASPDLAKRLAQVLDIPVTKILYPDE
ncbi:helix-turn-helix transcriptional regulator [Chromobacterium phragmitis]|uniref:Helix-turn-helix transcriptional regulator n=1 Tax=Chromobacterium phragmitis TaxID=2202141 RepID=A0ABV0J0R9_9NEIS